MDDAGMKCPMDLIEQLPPRGKQPARLNVMLDVG
jgi:hypothetical protein